MTDAILIIGLWYAIVDFLFTENSKFNAAQMVLLWAYFLLK